MERTRNFEVDGDIVDAGRPIDATFFIFHLRCFFITLSVSLSLTLSLSRVYHLKFLGQQDSFFFRVLGLIMGAQ
jgi:hypothetical protein